MKKILVVLSLTVLIILSCLYFFPKQKEITKNNLNLNNNLAIMLENEKGEYEVSSLNTWPDNKYIYNDVLSYCERGSNLEWDNSLKTVKVKDISKSDKCYLYFDFDHNSYVQDLSGHNNDGKYENIVSLTDEGVTTSNESQSGYVDCGLIDYDFKNTISVIMRVKWNDLHNKWSGLFGNIGYENDLRRGIVVSLLPPNNQPFIQIFDNNGHASTVTSDKIIEINKWYTIIGIYDGNTLTFCIDDTCSAKNYANNLSVSKFPIFLGGYSCNYLNGKFVKCDYGYNTFSDLLIYDRAISNEEKEAFLKNLNPSNQEDLILWYKFGK